MDDLTITRLCAEAMGIDFSKGYASITCKECEEYGVPYNPLHDDAQAMALVKKFRIHLNYGWDKWHASHGYENSFGESRDLNRAICECIAKMEKAK